MTNQHVTRDEWLRYRSNKRDAALSIRILAHVAVCKECRELYDRSADLASAASAYAASLSGQNQYSGFAAVASRDPMNMGAAAASTLTVDIEVENGQAQFLADSIEASGSARKYALNPNGDGTCLREDLYAFTLTLSGSTLTLTVEEALEGRVYAALRCINAELPLIFSGREGSTVLPGDDMYVLEITFI